MALQICSLDQLRALHPQLGAAVYALDPLGTVTLEIYTPDGGVFSFQGASEAECFASAFPPEPEPEPAPPPSLFD